MGNGDEDDGGFFCGDGRNRVSFEEDGELTVDERVS